MKLSDKNIDQMFRDAANSAPEVEFKDAYWDEMNAFLDLEEKNKRGIYSMLSFGILALIGVSSLFLVPNENKINQEVFASTVNNFVKDNNVNTLVASKSTIQKTVNSENIVNNDNNAQFAKNTSATLVSNNELDKTSNNAVKRATVSNIENSDVQNDYSKSLNNIKPSNNSSSSFVQTQKAKNIEFNKFRRQQGLVKSPIFSSSEKLENNSNELDNISEKISNLPFNSEESLAAQTPSVHNALLSHKMLQRLKDRVYLELGAGLIQDYNSQIEGRSFTFNAAINYEMRKDWFRLRTGVGANINTNTNITYRTEAKIYDFGSRVSSNELIYKDLYDFYIPLEIGASFKSVTFGLGYRYNFLNHSKSEFNTYADGILKEQGTYYGLTEGLKENTSTAYMFIERKLIDRIDLGIKMGTYLNSRTTQSEEFIMQGENIKPTYGFVYLKLNLNK